MKSLIMTIIFCIVCGITMAQNEVQSAELEKLQRQLDETRARLAREQAAQAQVAPTPINSQLVSNIRIQQHDAMLTVTYDLTTKSNIEAFISFDNGATYKGPLKYVSGAIGEEVIAGKDKTFVWNIVPEIGYVDYPNATVKIVSTPSNTFSPIAVAETTQKEITKWYKPWTFGVEGAVGGLADYDYMYFDIGVRFSKNYITRSKIIPYISWDIVKLKYSLLWDSELHLLSGVTISTQYIGREKALNFYSSLRPGLGFMPYYGMAMVMEFDLGVNYKRFIIGSTFGLGVLEDFGYGLRLGYNFGW